MAIVLGASTTDESMSSVYAERINHAIWLYNNDYVDYIIATGGKANGNKNPMQQQNNIALIQVCR